MRLQRPIKIYKKSECSHEWQTFRETIKVENSNYTIAHLGQERPYFIVRACVKCKKKHYVSMK